MLIGLVWCPRSCRLPICPSMWFPLPHAEAVHTSYLSMLPWLSFSYSTFTVTLLFWIIMFISNTLPLPLLIILILNFTGKCPCNISTLAFHSYLFKNSNCHTLPFFPIKERLRYDVPIWSWKVPLRNPLTSKVLPLTQVQLKHQRQNRCTVAKKAAIALLSGTWTQSQLLPFPPSSLRVMKHRVTDWSPQVLCLFAAKMCKAST